MSWSELVTRALDGSGSGVAERITIRSGELSTRVRGHEVSLIRTVWSDEEWFRVCAALASQPLFRARLLSGELPEAAAQVFALLGLHLVPRGWDDLVATCSCDQWRGRCPHVGAAASALAVEAGRDPFALVRWAGRERRAMVELVRDLPTGTMGPSAGETAFDDDHHRNPSGEHPATGGGDFTVRAQTAHPLSPATFWSAPPLPPVPPLPEDVGGRVRAAAPGPVADHLPGFHRSGKPFSPHLEGP